MRSSRRLAASRVPSPPSTTRASATRATSRPEATRQAARAASPPRAAVASSRDHRRPCARGARPRDRAPRTRPPRGRGAPGRRWSSRALLRSCASSRRAASIALSTRAEGAGVPGSRSAAQVQEELAVALGPLDGRWARRPARRSPWPAPRRPPRAGPARAGRGSLTSPPRPTSARPTSNCGFTSTTASASGASTRARAGRILRAEMKDTSITARLQASGTSAAERLRALVCSRSTTRGWPRSDSWIWPRPVSTA